jgi:TatD DNase family protein
VKPQAKDYFSVGIHPWILEEENQENNLQKVESALSHPNCLAIGECGLDKKTSSNFQLQQKIFKQQIILSEKYLKPLIIHGVHASNELIQLKKELKTRQNWIFHGFNGSTELGLQLIQNGFYLSFGAHLLHPNAKARKNLTSFPINKLFFETDNSTLKIAEIYQAASEILNISIQELQYQINQNFEFLFGPNIV